MKIRLVLQMNTVLRGWQVSCSHFPVRGSRILCIPEDCNVLRTSWCAQLQNQELYQSSNNLPGSPQVNVHLRLPGTPL